MNEGIKYLNSIVRDYLQFDVKTYINLSKSASCELYKKDPEVLIWHNKIDNLLCITSREEYYNFLNLESYREQNKHCDRISKVLFKIKDNEKIKQILDSLLNERDYLSKVLSLLNILDNQKVLELK